MIARKNITITAFLVIIFSLLSTSGGPAYAEDAGRIGGDQVSAERHFFIPEAGIWASFDTGIPEDPMEYTFRLKCFDAEAGYIDCLNENERFCPDGEGGKLVYWLSRLRNSNQPWVQMSPEPSCIYSEEPQDVGEQISAVILSEFQSRPIAAGSLGMQPSPHTLIGAETNFYVDAREQAFDFVLLGQDLRIIATPTEYEWTYGDGSAYGPAPFAGGSLPESRWGEKTATSHAYSATGDFQASVAVHFSGEYSINGGPFVPIDGRATVPSAPQTVSVWRSTSSNVADNCLINPAGYGC